MIKNNPAGALVSAMLGLVAFNRYRLKKSVETELQMKDEEIRRQKELLEEQARQIETANHALSQAALSDQLTGLRNRRFYSLIIDSEVARLARARAEEDASDPNRDLLFYLLDMDRFKSINETHGHEAGDQVIAETARRLLAAARKSDYVLRWGGGQFLVLSRETGRAEAAAIAERIREAVSSEPVTLTGGERVAVTASIGWAPFPWDDDLDEVTPEEVLAIADRALFLAKEGGRDRALGAVPSRESITGTTAALAPAASKRARFIDSKSAPL